MSDKQDEKQSFKRFRITRKVKPEKPPEPAPEPYSQKVLREVATDDADKGTPEMDRAVSRGCMGCLRVTLLFFLIIGASIITTWCIRR
ncbi:MAG TPA: hypothetical protein VNT75_27105 [Symbiobacteriaceae bacterium]|nr:hypothetical protein [Symbiobacteriaceae bacterium]